MIFDFNWPWVSIVVILMGYMDDARNNMGFYPIVVHDQCVAILIEPYTVRASAFKLDPASPVFMQRSRDKTLEKKIDG